MENQIIDIGYEPAPLPKILVVDDEPSLQTLIADTLDSDYRVIPAYNGREGVEMATHLMPDLILMDVMMPDIGGYEAVRLLHDNPGTRAIPVVVMTAQDFDASTIQMIKHEPNVAAFLMKPFRPKGLRDVVRSVIGKKE